MPAATSGMKPSLAYADLTALDSTSTLANTLPVWRNAATGQSTQLFNEWASGIVGGTTPACQRDADPHADVARSDGDRRCRRPSYCCGGRQCLPRPA